MVDDEERPGDRDGAQDGFRRMASAPALGPAHEPDRPGLDRLTAKPAFQVECELFGRSVPLAGLFLEAFQTDRLEVAVHAPIQLAGRLRGFDSGPCRGPHWRKGPARRGRP